MKRNQCRTSVDSPGEMHWGLQPIKEAIADAKTVVEEEHSRRHVYKVVADILLLER